MIRRPYYSYVQETNQISLEDVILIMIKQKRRGVELYKKLLKQTSDSFLISFFSDIDSSEELALKRLERQYASAFGPVPNYTVDAANSAFDNLLDGILLALKLNLQVITFEREAMDRIGLGGIGYPLIDYSLLIDMGQQDSLNTIYTYYLHSYS